MLCIGRALEGPVPFALTSRRAGQDKEVLHGT